jgi:hypothetical protein
VCFPAAIHTFQDDTLDETIAMFITVELDDGRCIVVLLFTHGINSLFERVAGNAAQHDAVRWHLRATGTEKYVE